MSYLFNSFNQTDPSWRLGRYSFRHARVLSLAILMNFIPHLVLADDTVTEVERRTLIAIVRQIDQLQELTNQAQAAASIDARVKFNYPALHGDLKQMSQAIENHLNKPSRTPRQIPDLSKSYSH
jgi:RAQPRD family integrative conjugative element protein